MPRTTSSALALALIVALSPQGRAGDPVEDARALLSKDDPRAAVRGLEAAMPEVGKDRLPALLETLREAYAGAIRKAASEGKADEASAYREGLALLSRSLPKPAEVEKATPPEPEPRPVPRTEPKPPPAELDTQPSPQPSKPTEDDLAQMLPKADRAWKEKRFLDAGALYSELAKDEKLPPSRRDHWAYCRLVAVLERINAQPRSPAEWAEIHAEIDHIRLLSPKNWYSEYLRNVVVERSGGVKRGDPGKLVLRGAAPDEKPPAAAPAGRLRPQTKPASRPEPPRPSREPAAEAGPAPGIPEAEVGRPGPPVGNWKTFQTPNFQIFHDDEPLARKVALKAEAARREAARRWTGAEPRGAWSPRCDLYLYPTASIFAAETKQPPDSPGFSTAGLSGGRVTARLVKLRADYPKMLDAVLPHEVTHVVLADLFPTAQIPRWADEGMAVLSEPEGEQALRARDLAEPLAKDVLFRLDVLMTSDYPNGSHWALYYAQSVSLTRYLVGLGTPPQFAQFVKKTQTQGLDLALRQAYGIDGAADLERRWKVHARNTLNPATAAADPAKESAGEAIRR